MKVMNILNKSVKTLNNGITTLISNITSETNYKTEIDFIKFETLNLNILKLTDIKELENYSDLEYYLKDIPVLYIIYSKCFLNIYYLNDELEFLCFFNQKFNFNIDKIGTIFSPFIKICPINSPLIGIISNKEPYFVDLNKNNFKKNISSKIFFKFFTIFIFR